MTGRSFAAAAVLLPVIALAIVHGQPKPAVSRAALLPLEKGFDQRIATRFAIDDPIDLLGATRGLYLEGFGVVFTTELSPVVAPGITPFRPTIPKDQVAKVWERKKARLPVIRQVILDMLVSSAAGLKDLPPEEQIVVGISLHYYSWEDTRELPSQIVMQARRRSLLDFEAKRITATQLNTQLRTREM